MDSIETRRKYAKGLEVQERIVTSALEQFAMLGFAGASVMTLATAARVSKNQLFHHFPNKEAIALACVERVRRDWLNDVATPAEIYPESAAQLQYVLSELRERLASGWPGLRLLAMLIAPVDGVPSAVSAAAGSALDEMLKTLRGQIKGARREGSITSDMKARPLADYTIATLLGAAMIGNDDDDRCAGIVDALRSQMLKG